MRHFSTLLLLFSCILFSDAQDFISLSGKVTRENGTPVPDVYVYTQTGDTAVTDQVGDYVIDSLLPDREYILKAFKPDNNWREGLSICDLSAMRRKILNIDSLTFFQRIAADIIKDANVSSFDAVLLHKMILCVEIPPRNAEPKWNYTPWEIVPLDLDFTTFPHPTNPPITLHNYSDSLIVQAATENIPNLDFIAVKAGDIVDIERLDTTYQPTFSLSNITVCNEQASVLLSVKDFENLIGFQFTIQWDSTLLEFENITEFNLESFSINNINVEPQLIDRATIKFSWLERNLLPVTLPEDYPICKINFRVIGESGGSSVVRFADDPISKEVLIARDECAAADARYESGSIRYENVVPRPSLEIFNSATCSQTGSGGIDITPTNGTPPFSFEWNNGSREEDLFGVASGWYWVTMTDVQGCSTVSDPIEIGSNNYDVNLRLEEGRGPTCTNSFDGRISIDLTSGVTPITYSWNTGDTTAVLAQLSGGQNYAITATDANGCADTLSLFLERPPLLDFSGMITNATRDTSTNGSVSLDVEGGVPPYQFAWNIGDTTQSLSNLAVGNYIVTVTDANGCSLSKGFAVSFNITTSTDDLAKAGLQVTHFPNPVTQNLYFSLQSVPKFPLDLQIVDVTGRVLQTVVVRSDNFSLALQNYSAGLYLFHFSEKGKVLASGRLVKQ